MIIPFADRWQYCTFVQLSVAMHFGIVFGMKTANGKILLGAALAAILMTGCEPKESGRLVVAKGYDVPKAWEPIPIMGRTFYSHASSGHAFEEIHKRFPNLAMFDHPWLEVQLAMRQNDISGIVNPELPKNAWTNFPTRITEVFKAKSNEWAAKRIAEFERDYPGHPFTISCHGARPIGMLKERFETDRADFAAWRAQHPAFFSFCAFDEYDNDAQGMTWQIPEKCNDLGLMRRYWRQYAPVTMYGFLRQWVDNDYAKSVSYHFGTKDLYGLWSVTPSVGHQIARKGLTFLFYEAEHGSTASPWRWGAAYARGAARQFKTTFGWYSAMFTNNSLCRDGTSPEGKRGVAVWRDGFTYWPNPDQPKRVPHLGSSRSLLRRNVRYGYLIGSIQSLIECGNHGLYATDADGRSWTLSPYGEDYNAVFEWHRNRDRGTVYAPVAFLASIDENFHRQCFNLFPAKDEGSLPAFFFTLVPTLTSSPTVFAEPKLGKEGCLWNSEFGEIADVVCPDAEQPHGEFTDFLSGYKAAFLIGYHNWKVTDLRALDEYAKRGGTLFCSCDQIADGLVSSAMAGVAFGDRSASSGKKLLDATGAAVEDIEETYTFRVGTSEGAVPFLRDENGTVVAWANDYGRGRVVTVAARRMMPDCVNALKEDGWKRHAFCNSDLHKRMAAGTLRFPIVHHLLQRVQRDVMPIDVAGDVQWGLNRTAKGWMLWLINNNGVRKFAFEPEDIDLSKTSNVTVDLKDLKGRRVVDITDVEKDVPVEVRDGKFTVAVKPGEDCRIAIE